MFFPEQSCVHGSGVQESAPTARFLGTSPRNGRDDHVCPKGSPWSTYQKIRELGYNLMKSYMFMDQESTNRQ